MSAMSQHVERAAVGRMANLGDLYDIRTDRFCRGISLLNRSAPPTVAVRSMDSPNTYVDFTLGDGYQEKFDLMDVSVDLQVSLLSGLAEIEGYGSFFEMKKGSKKAMQATLRYRMKTKVERMNLLSEELKKHVSPNALDFPNATHVVTEVEWGANVIVSVTDENNEDSNENEVRGNLKATMEEMKSVCSVSGGVKSKRRQCDKVCNRKYTFKLFGDLLIDAVPPNFDQAIDLIQNIPQQLASANNGKGKPLKYVLFPLSDETFQKHLSFVRIDTIMASLEDSVTEFVCLFDTVSCRTLEINNIIKSINEIQLKTSCIHQDYIDELKLLKEEMGAKESELKKKLAQILIKVRSGKSDRSKLQSLRDEYEKHGLNWTYELRNRAQAIQRSVERKIVWAKSCIDNDVQYVVSQAVIDDIINRNTDVDVMILYASEEAKEADEEKWEESQSEFVNLIKTQSVAKKTSFVYVDGDFVKSAVSPRKGIRIKKHIRVACNISIRTNVETESTESCVKLNDLTISKVSWYNSHSQQPSLLGNNNSFISMLAIDPVGCCVLDCEQYLWGKQQTFRDNRPNAGLFFLNPVAEVSSVLENMNTEMRMGAFHKDVAAKLDNFLDRLPVGSIVVSVFYNGQAVLTEDLISSLRRDFGVTGMVGMITGQLAFVAQKGSPDKAQLSNLSELDVRIHGGPAADDVKIELINGSGSCNIQ